MSKEVLVTLKDELLVFLQQIQRQISYMSDEDIKAQINKSGHIAFRNCWMPKTTTMTISIREIPNEESTKEREEKSSRKST